MAARSLCLKTFITAVLFAAALPFAHAANAGAPLLRVTPESVFSGEPALVRAASSSRLVSLTFNSVPVPILSYHGESAGIIGTDLRMPAGTYPITAKFSDGSVASATLAVRERPRETAEAPPGIPDELGGDTAVGSAALVRRLAIENALLLGLWTNPRMLWTKPFRFPVLNPVITDRYGYLREAAGSEIAHKGTDFRALVGTPVYAMNRGVVRLARSFVVYGTTVVVDHGRGIQTLYLHLSKRVVGAGELVVPGQLIGYSGQTGYTSGPHLHISVKVGGVSVDPERFLALFTGAE